MLFPHLNLQQQPVVTGRKTHGQRGDDRIISKLKTECAGTSLPFLYGFSVFFLSWETIFGGWGGWSLPSWLFGLCLAFLSAASQSGTLCSAKQMTPTVERLAGCPQGHSNFKTADWLGVLSMLPWLSGRICILKVLLLWAWKINNKLELKQSPHNKNTALMLRLNLRAFLEDWP